MVGISGGVSGLMGAYVALFPRVRLWLVLLFIRFKLAVIWYIAAWLALQVMCAAAGIKGVGWFAHLGGFAAGLAVGLYMRRRRPWIRRPTPFRGGVSRDVVARSRSATRRRRSRGS